MNTHLDLPHGRIALPAFFPDATRGVVRGLDALDLSNCGVPGMVMSTFHLMQSPGSTTIRKLGGLHRFTGWDAPLITDSGGFQIYSLIRQNVKNGTLTDKGLSYSAGNGSRQNLTPEKAIQLQLSYGADIIYCLDDCTNSGEAAAEQEVAVTRTINWAQRCRTQFDQLVAQKRVEPETQPRIYGVIQGGNSKELRQRCAAELLEVGFDGFGFGGWPFDASGALLGEIIEYTRSLIPSEIPMHALGIGHPETVLWAARVGYDLFDSTLPTRDARRGRLYRFAIPPSQISWFREHWFQKIYIQDKKYIKCDERCCPHTHSYTSERYSLAFLHHLFKINDALYIRLATLHNLAFMMQLMRQIQILRRNEA